MTTRTTAPPIVSLGLERLKKLPALPEVWQLGIARIPSWVTEERDRPFRPLIALCRGAAGGPVGNGDLCAPGDPQGPAALAAVAQLAVTRGVGHRPARVQVSDPSLADAVRDSLAGCGIEVELVHHLEALDEVIADMMRQVGGKAATLRFFEPGIELGLLRDFAEAAEEFHRAAPWNHLGDDDLVVVERPAAPKGLGCFNVLGAGGIERGLGFFLSRAAFDAFKKSEPFDPKIAAAGLWLMSFDEIVEWPIADSELWEAHGLPVAGERGFPSLVCHLPNGGARPADAERLAFVATLLRALAATTEEELDSGRWLKPVRTHAGQVAIKLLLPSIAEADKRSGRRAMLDADELPDRRIMERTLRDVRAMIESGRFQSAEEFNAFLAHSGGKLPKHSKAQTPRGNAQELIDQAFAERGRMRIKLARQALVIWPDCAEAWVLQAEQTSDPERQRDLYLSAVAAAERALGEKPFAEDVGHFWGILETRPYMRARNGLAGALWNAGDREGALVHWQDLLRLNPEDNQGVRDILVPRLLEAHRDAEAEAVLEQYAEDASAMLGYARALLEFRRSCASPAAQAKLDAAMRRNANVPKYLTGRLSLRGPLPDSYGVGSDDEAQIASSVLYGAWHGTDGAIAWLGRSLRPPKSERRAQRNKGKPNNRR